MIGTTYKNGQKLESPDRRRTAGKTEHSWCKAVSGGTGITVLAFQLSKPVEISLLRNALHKLQNSHPILRSKLHYNTSKKSFSFITLSTPQVQIKTYDISSTSDLLVKRSNGSDQLMISPLQAIHEHEMNNNSWFNPSDFPIEGIDVFFASVYELPVDSKWIVALRFHTAVCDRTTAVSLLRELIEFAGREEDGGGDSEIDGKVCLGIEDMIPSGKRKKTIWAHGIDMLEYSVNSLFRIDNLKFKDIKRPRCSEFVRLQMSLNDTSQILAVSATPISQNTTFFF